MIERLNCEFLLYSHICNGIVTCSKFSVSTEYLTPEPLLSPHLNQVKCGYSSVLERSIMCIVIAKEKKCVVISVSLLRIKMIFTEGSGSF